MTNTNTRRFDLSNRLIHFFRAIDLDDGPGFTPPEDWGPGAINEDTKLSPFFLLRNAIRSEKLWATWSMRRVGPKARKDWRRTIYGRDPAVCFTDMPIAAFIEAGEARSQRGEAMSAYGLLLPKSTMQNLGARAVIYGLSSSPDIPKGTDGGPRIIPADALPLAEQYRYVTHTAAVDWTHEREWRWPCRDEEGPNNEAPPVDWREMAGLSLSNPALNGLGVIVKSERQADQIIHDVLTLTDRGDLSFPQYDFVIVRERLGDISQLRDPSRVEELIENAAFTLDFYYRMKKSERQKLVHDFESAVHQVENDAGEIEDGELGGCWLWLTDARHRLTRALVYEKRAFVNKDGRYLVTLPEFNDGRSLQQREAMAKHLAAWLSDNHSCPATYHSVLRADDPDGVPHYSSPPLDNTFIFNYANDEDDY